MTLRDDYTWFAFCFAALIKDFYFYNNIWFTDDCLRCEVAKVSINWSSTKVRNFYRNCTGICEEYLWKTDGSNRNGNIPKVSQKWQKDFASPEDQCKSYKKCSGHAFYWSSCQLQCFDRYRERFPDWEWLYSFCWIWGLKLVWNWCMSMFKRIKWVDRKCTISKSSAVPGFIKELGFTFCKEIAEAVLADNLLHSCTAYHLYR